MTVSFAPSPAGTDVWQVQCSCGSIRPPNPVIGRDAADTAAKQLRPCSDSFCAAAGAAVHPYAVPDAPTVTVSNAYAAGFLAALGIQPADGEGSGSVPAADMLGRTLIALAFAPDDSNLDRLHTIAVWASERELVVRWTKR